MGGGAGSRPGGTRRRGSSRAEETLQAEPHTGHEEAAWAPRTAVAQVQPLVLSTQDSTRGPAVGTCCLSETTSTSAHPSAQDVTGVQTASPLRGKAGGGGSETAPGSDLRQFLSQDEFKPRLVGTPLQHRWDEQQTCSEGQGPSPGPAARPVPRAGVAAPLGAAVVSQVTAPGTQVQLACHRHSLRAGTV